MSKNKFRDFLKKKKKKKKKDVEEEAQATNTVTSTGAADTSRGLHQHRWGIKAIVADNEKVDKINKKVISNALSFLKKRFGKTDK